MSEQPTPGKGSDSRTNLEMRDAETQIALGIFVTVISLPVLVGTLFAVRPHAQIVNLIAGLVLLAVGIILCWFGWRSRAAQLSGTSRDNR